MHGNAVAQEVGEIGYHEARRMADNKMQRTSGEVAETVEEGYLQKREQDRGDINAIQLKAVIVEIATGLNREGERSLDSNA